MFNTQKEAMDYARKESKARKAELIVHGEEGEIVSRDSHGKDPVERKG
jgi:hypothetical protein